LVVPLSEFPLQFTATAVVGEDLTTLLGIQKYIKELPANLSGESIGDFPSHICSKTDEYNGLNDPELVKKVLESDTEIVITQKLDGSSITLIVENGELAQVCSRNLSKRETENSTFWKAARKLTIPSGWTGVIQGELCGNGIQSNPMRLEDVRIFVFQIKHKDLYMSYDVMKQFCDNELNCDAVPLIATLEVAATIKIWADPLQKLQELADLQTYKSGGPGEGIVVRPKSYIRSYESRRPLGFKLINRNYKD
jgi:RNA ligase (TIGR02306 family)